VNPVRILTDSSAFRWVTKRGPTRAVFRSPAFRRMNVARIRAVSSRAVRRDPTRFAEVRTFCLFIGHMKSGTSLLGGLLDAHPDMIVSDEVDALRYVEEGFTRDQLFHVLDRGSRAEARKHRVTARRLSSYSFEVPGQFQGSSDHPLVVGDGRAGPTTQRVGEHPELIERFQELLEGAQLRIIQVIRNPFDPIAVSIVRGHRTFADAIDHYFRRCDVLDTLLERLDARDVYPIRYEDLVADPTSRLAAICSFLGARADPDHLKACRAVIHPQPHRSREMVAWTQPWISEVESRIAAFDFLSGYAFEQEVVA
jgi:sulfotransferase family protein